MAAFAEVLPVEGAGSDNWPPAEIRHRDIPALIGIVCWPVAQVHVDCAEGVVTPPESWLTMIVLPDHQSHPMKMTLPAAAARAVKEFLSPRAKSIARCQLPG